MAEFCHPEFGCDCDVDKPTVRVDSLKNVVEDILLSAANVQEFEDYYGDHKGYHEALVDEARRVADLAGIDKSMVWCPDALKDEWL